MPNNLKEQEHRVSIRDLVNYYKWWATKLQVKTAYFLLKIAATLFTKLAPSQYIKTPAYIR